MPKAYSQDLRDRVVRAVEAGASAHEAARRLKSARARRSGGLRVGGRPDQRRPSRWAASTRRWMLTSHGCWR